MDKIRVLVVDDSAYNRQTIKSMLENDPEVEVVAIATDGMDAMTKTIRLTPDVITLDFEMPNMDGFTFLRWLMQERPTPVIMVSSYSDSKMAFKALELGAVDFIAKPTRRASTELHNIEKDLIAKVKGTRQLNMQVIKTKVKQQEERAEREKQDEGLIQVDLIAIGSSTGGPSALQNILTRLPSDLPAAITISQHMPKGFTKPLADRLDKLCNMSIKEAETGDLLKKGTVYICPGGCHMEFKSRGNGVQLVIGESKPEDKYTPSVDRMMISAATHFDNRILGVVLTGMGNDGMEGMKDLHKRGCFTVAEAEETCVVFGMPQEVIKAKAARCVLPLDRIASEIRRQLMGERRA